jgi:hypothetical protein
MLIHVVVFTTECNGYNILFKEDLGHGIKELWSVLPDFLSHQVLIRELQPVDLAVFGPATSEEEGSSSSVRVDTSSLLYSTCCESPKLLLGVMRRIFLKTNRNMKRLMRVESCW